MKAFRQTIQESSVNDKLDKLSHNKPLSGSRLKQLTRDFPAYEDIDLEQWQGYPPPRNSSQVTKNEIHNLVSLGQFRDQWERDMVMHDKKVIKAFREYLDKEGLDVDLDRIDDYLKQASPILLSLKRYYNRPRPYTLAKKLGLELSFFPLKTAETPSYPSGHSTQGRLAAKLIADKVPFEHRRNILDIGERIGHSRQIAGAHFQSDTEFGHRLGDELYRLASTSQKPELSLEAVLGLNELEVANKQALQKYIGDLKTGKMRAATIVKYTDSGKKSTIGKEVPDAAVDDDEKDKEKSKTTTTPLKKGELGSLQDKTSADRDKGTAGAGGPVASQGESRYCNATDTLNYNKFNKDNDAAIAEETKSFGNKYPNADQKEALAAVGLDSQSDKGKKYIASREVWARKELKRMQDMEKPNVFSKDFGGNEKAYMAWMRTAYDGAIATQVALKESRMNTDEPHKTIQSTKAVDKQVQSDLLHKANDPKLSKEDREYYQKQHDDFEKYKEYHDTYTVGEDEKGRTFIVHISNKKNSSMKDIQHNSTPADSFGRLKDKAVSKNLKDAGDEAIDIVTSVNKKSNKASLKIDIDESFTAVAEAASPKRVEEIKERGSLRGRQKNGKPRNNKQALGCYLEDNNISEDDWNKLSTQEQLQHMQDFMGDDEWHEKNGTTVSYDPFTKIYIKVGEVNTGGHRKLNKIRDKVSKEHLESDSVKSSGDMKRNEASAVDRAHNHIIKTMNEEDAKLGYPKDGKNGPNTQGYIESVMQDMHIEDYIMTPDEDDDKMLIQMGGHSVKPSHYRETMAKNTGYEFGTNEGLVQHMKENCTVELDKDGNATGKIVVNGKDSTTEIFNNTYRTAGGGVQKHATSYGPDTQKGLQETAVKDRTNSKHSLAQETNSFEKGKLLGFNEWNS